MNSQKVEDAAAVLELVPGDEVRVDAAIGSFVRGRNDAHTRGPMVRFGT